jgi:hypothetical protein|tara:strand:+ start:12340 stop:12546 length:207 start_codon:yes stop_codon:yes gene_type:complete
MEQMTPTTIGVFAVFATVIMREVLGFLKTRNGNGKMTEAETKMLLQLGEIRMHQKRSCELLEKLVDKN